jgi:hypothetical protein
VGIVKGCIEKEFCQIMTAGIEGKRKRRRPRKRWTDEYEEYLEIMGTINCRLMAKRPEGMGGGREDCVRGPGSQRAAAL